MEIRKLIDANVGKFEKWDSQLESYLYHSNFPNEYNDDESIQVFYDTNQLLIDLARIFYKFGRFKDTWDDSKCYLNIYGQNLLLKSIKTEHTFDWGVDRYSFFLQSYISYPENIRNMGDDFWESILKLPQYGQFRFKENASIGSKEQQYFNNKKSNLFRLMRNYFLHEVNNLELDPEERDYDMNLGWFELKWEFGTGWKQIIDGGCHAFKTLYNLNYQLWKIHNLRKKKYAY